MTIPLFPDFYDTNRTQQIAILLLNGWGYNFFRREDQLRADSALIRGKTSDILGELRKAVTDAEHSYRRAMLPPRTRDSPEPAAAVYARASALEALGQELGRVETSNRTAPVPETDRMRQRHRNEADLLAKLVAADQRLVAQAEMVRTGFAKQPVTAEWLLEHMADVKAAFAGLAVSIRERKNLLSF